MDLILFLIFGAVGLASYKFFGKRRGTSAEALVFAGNVPPEVVGAFLLDVDRGRPITHVEQLRVLLRRHGLQMDAEGIIEIGAPPVRHPEDN